MKEITIDFDNHNDAILENQKVRFGPSILMSSLQTDGQRCKRDTCTLESIIKICFWLRSEEQPVMLKGRYVIASYPPLVRHSFPGNELAHLAAPLRIVLK